MIEALTIRPLSPEILGDYLTFFDREAFVDNPDWAGCYCFFYLADPAGKPWGERTGEENRADASQWIAAGKMQGYLAYQDEKVVGWCHAAPRAIFPTLREDPDLDGVDSSQVGSIVCFVVAKPYRRTGVARSLLDAACEGFRAEGIGLAEAYPRVGTDSEAANYHGPLEMYREAGFEVVKEFEGFALVRKRL